MLLHIRGLGVPNVPCLKQPRLSNCQQRAWYSRECSRRQKTSCKVSKQLVQLETAVLADMPTEQVIHLLKKHGVDIQTVVDDPTPAKLQQQQQQQQQQQTQQRGSMQPRGEQQPQQELQHNEQWHEEQQLPQQNGQQQQQQQQPLSDAKHRHHQQQHYAQSETEHHLSQLNKHLSFRSSHVAAAAAKRSLLLSKLAAARVAARAQIVRLPLRLTIAGRAGSRRYLTVPVDVEGVGFVDFLIDSSTFYSRITPAFRSKLGLGPADGVPVITRQKHQAQTAAPGPAAADDTDSKHEVSSTASSSSSSSSNSGSNSGGSRLRLRQRVQLPDLWLGTAQLPKQQAYVSPLLLLPSRRQASSSKSPLTAASSASAIAGSLGVQVLRHFELDVDVAGNQLAAHPAGHVELGLCDVTGMTAVPCRYTKSGAIVLPVSLAGSAPFTGLLDMSATTSIMNWEAAALLGMTCAERQQEPQEQQRASGQDGSYQTGSNNNSPQPRVVGDSMYGYFGSIEVVPDEMLPKPILPHMRDKNYNDANTNKQQYPSLSHQPLTPLQKLDQGGADSGSKDVHDDIVKSLHDPSPDVVSSSSPASDNNRDKYLTYVDNNSDTSSGSYLTMPLRMQRHQMASSQLKLVLGARLSMAFGNDDHPGSLTVPPPPRIGVAGLKGLSALGISGQPAMVIGADIWARDRAVLCLKAGKLFMQ